MCRSSEPDETTGPAIARSQQKYFAEWDSEASEPGSSSK